MTTTSYRGMKSTAALSLAVLTFLGTGVANAATTTPAAGTGTSTTASEQAMFDSYSKMQGAYQTFSIDPATLNAWAKMGFHIDLAGSVAASNTVSDAKGFNEVRLKASFDNAEFKANSPYSSYVDPDVALPTGTGGNFQNGLGLLVSGGDVNANMTTSALATKSGVRAGQLTNEFASANNFPGYDNDPKAVSYDAATGSFRVGLGDPKSAFLDGGVPMGLNQQQQGAANPDFSHSDFPQTWFTDSYTGNDTLRNADMSLNGTQRTLVATNYTDCSAASVTCVLEVQPVVAGSHNGSPVQIAVGAPALMTITSTRHKVVPTYTSEATAYTKANGEKVWFTPINEGAKGPIITYSNTQDYNRLSPDAPIVPQDPAAAGAAQLNLVKPRISVTDATKNADGSVSVILNTDGYDTLQPPVVTLKGKPVVNPSYQQDVNYWEGQVAQYNDAPAMTGLQNAQDALVAATAAAPASTSDYTLTLTNKDAALQETWTDYTLADYTVGQTFGGNHGTIGSKFTVTSNANNVATFDVSLTDNSLPLTTTATVTDSPTISTAISGTGWSDGVTEPGYDAFYVTGTPVVPTQPTTPVDVPAQETTPETPVTVPEVPVTGDSGNTPVAVEGDSASRPFKLLGESSSGFGGPAKSVPAVEATSVTPTSDDNTGLWIAVAITGGLTLIGTWALFMRRKVAKAIVRIKP